MSDQKKLPEHMAETLSGDGTTRQLDLWYPRVEGNPQFVELGLIDVRAADSIRISYDFERDGWKIEQASTFEWEADDKVCDPDWQEVAFVQAWGREKAMIARCKHRKPGDGGIVDGCGWQGERPDDGKCPGCGVVGLLRANNESDVTGTRCLHPAGNDLPHLPKEQS